ncbi:MAG TPA: ISAs1 family transposase [Flavobacteriaceae bacterium]|jgi:predicted transposase YbfD/YdcC|nr:ISAs1 family transposase [Flavobacteriaceae bacterium]
MIPNFVEIKNFNIMKTSLHEHLQWLPDPRTNNKQHLLIDVIILTIIAVISGANSWDSIEIYANKKKDFLSKILELPNGIPSHDTINRIISSLHVEKFNALFIDWVNSIKNNNILKEVIAIDGKALRRSKDSFHEQPAIHIVNAWASSNELVLGQLKTADKSNEITAIPLLLNLLDIKDSIITIDAMGTQKEIAETIIKAEADYILALKGNQGYLNDNVRNQFNVQKIASTYEMVEKNRGRIETRKCEVITNLEYLNDISGWKGLKSIVKITAIREVKEKKSVEERFYISSLLDEAKNYNSYIRQHWGVENSLHWTLDMTFGEDYQRKRKKKAAQNFSLIQKFALNLLRKEKSTKASLVSKRLMAGWDDEYLMKILGVHMR